MFKSSLSPSLDRALIFFPAVASFFALGIFGLAPQPSRNVAVVFAPWVHAGEAMRRVAAADGSLVRLGRFPFILVAHPEAAGFPERLARQGALLVLDAQAVTGCSAD